MTHKIRKGNETLYLASCISCGSDMVKCKTCNLYKDRSSFYKEKRNANGLKGSCKDCHNTRERTYRAKNIKKIREKEAKYRKSRRKEENERINKWRSENPDRVSEISSKSYYKNHERNVEVRKVYRKNRLKNDIEFRIRDSLRKRLSTAIRNCQKSGSAVRDLGCSIEELKKHLESQFQSGMSWENWTTDGWHIDHITPLASFDLSDPEQLKKACHYTNLQPLWAEDNLVKSNKIELDDVDKKGKNDG